MAADPRVTKAFSAMKELGIPDEKTKPVLKSLLKISEKNWELIEQENYKALADAIFNSEEAEAAEKKKQLEQAEPMKAIEVETQIREESEQPSKRLRLRHQDNQASSSRINPSPNSSATLLRREELEVDEPPDLQPQLQSRAKIVVPEPVTRNDSQPVSPQQRGRNKGKQPVLQNPMAQLQGSDISQSGDAEKTHPVVAYTTDSDSAILSRRLRDKGKAPLSPQTAPQGKRSISDKPSPAVHFMEPKVELGIDVVPKQNALALINPKDKPLMDDTPRFEVPLAVIRPGMEQSGETRKQKKARISWKNENVVKTFLEACIHEVAENGREGASLKSLSWRKVAEILKNTHNFIVNQKQMKNHYDYLKGKYGAWLKLKSKGENVYDLLTNTFNLSEDEWSMEIKANRYVEPLRSRPLVFPKLCAQLFDGVVATGVEGSTRVRPCVEPIMMEDIQDSNEVQETSTSTAKCSSHVGVRSPIKKTNVSKNSNVASIEENMSKVIKLFIDKNNEPSIKSRNDRNDKLRSGPSIKSCNDKLRSLGWGAQNPLHMMALVIFCESATYRESWMLLQEDEAEDWVRMVGHRLGLVV